METNLLEIELLKDDGFIGKAPRYYIKVTYDGDCITSNYLTLEDRRKMASHFINMALKLNPFLFLINEEVEWQENQ
jgi:hypothetical protein